MVRGTRTGTGASWIVIKMNRGTGDSRRHQGGRLGHDKTLETREVGWRCPTCRRSWQRFVLEKRVSSSNFGVISFAVGRVLNMGVLVASGLCFMELCVCCYPSFQLSVVSVGFLLIAERFWIFFHVTED